MNDVVANLQVHLTAGSPLAYPAAFLAGLLISFTPRVYPVIPIQLGFIGGQVSATTTASAVNRRGARSLGFALSLLFVE